MVDELVRRVETVAARPVQVVHQHHLQVSFTSHSKMREKRRGDRSDVRGEGGRNRER